MKEYINWPIKENLIIKNKKQVFVKCFCEICGKQTADRSVAQMLKSSKIICRSCSLKNKSKEALEKRKKTCLERYGVENVFQCDDVKSQIESKLDRKEIGRKVSETSAAKTKEEISASNEKRKNTISNIENFYEDRQKKIKETCLKKYGVSSTLQIEKAKENLKLKYGVDNISQSDYWKQSVKNSSLEKYGVDWPTKSDEVIKKTQSTNLLKYGAKYKINDETFRKNLYKKWTAAALKRYDLDLINCELIDDVTLRCKTCGYERQIKNAQVEAKLSFCPNCHNNLKSRFEFLVSEHLKQHDISFSSNDRTVIKPKELDIYISNKNLAIEIDGLYFHQNKPKDYHLKKTEECLKNNIRLIHITDTMLLCKKDIVLSIIDAALGIFSKKIYARNCEVKIIDTKLYNDFCNKNHLQGSCPAPIKLGLFYKNELVQVESFSKPRFNKNFEYELVRECSKLGYIILGGKSKLFKYFIKNYSPNNIISYCDRSLFSGSSYADTLCMRLIKTTPPSYVYYKDGVVLTRYQCQKHKLKTFLPNFDENLSEIENMKANGYGIVYDCGENVYLWQK